MAAPIVVMTSHSTIVHTILIVVSMGDGVGGMLAKEWHSDGQNKVIHWWWRKNFMFATHQKQPRTVGPAHIDNTESMAIFRQFLASSMDTMKCICWNSSVSFCCGSIMAIQCLAGLDMFHLFFHPKHPNISLSDLAVPTQKAWQFWDSYWTFPWIQWTVIAETHQ